MKCVKEESVRAFTNITIVAIGYTIQDAAAAAAAWDYPGCCVRPKQPLVIHLLYILATALIRHINSVGEAGEKRADDLCQYLFTMN